MLRSLTRFLFIGFASIVVLVCVAGAQTTVDHQLVVGTVKILPMLMTQT
jgi:hypothetical protein